MFLFLSIINGTNIHVLHIACLKMTLWTQQFTLRPKAIDLHLMKTVVMNKREASLIFWIAVDSCWSWIAIVRADSQLERITANVEPEQQPMQPCRQYDSPVTCPVQTTRPSSPAQILSSTCPAQTAKFSCPAQTASPICPAQTARPSCPVQTASPSCPAQTANASCTASTTSWSVTSFAINSTN